MSKISASFYTQTDVVLLAKNLLGSLLITQIDGKKTVGMITETEAYAGAFDKACHAHRMKRSKKCSVMYEKGGVAYVYLCYGIHHLFNVVTNQKNVPEAVLIRAVYPLLGIDAMLNRRKKRTTKNLVNGPGKLCQAFGIDLKQNGSSLVKNTIWIEHKYQIKEEHIQITPRIGIDYAEEDALLPYRFFLPEKLQKRYVS